ncbi:MAG: hypothetical protein V1793_13340 [Pseudomonadota bacterium]
MDDKLTDQKARLKEEALAEHKRLSQLFIENRFQFELERNAAIEKLIQKAKSDKLRQLQTRWDNILKNSGSGHNRFVLIQMLFWDHINNHFRPALNRFRSKMVNP